MLNRTIHFFLTHKPIVFLLLAAILAGGTLTSPFPSVWGDWADDARISVDAIPDLGENQQIVFTRWPGRSPKDIEDQITYPLTTTLMGIPGVKTVRSNSVFGFSSIYLIFEEGTEFFWSRSRILEKLNALSPGTLPDNVQPQLGPDATALGQVFWYTLEGRDKEGNPTGGWDLQEIRSVQDFQVKYALASVGGVAEVASVGGFLQEYQIDVDPVSLKAYDLTLSQIMESVRNTNMDVGARTIEINRVEYTVRGLGYIKSIQDLENAVITTRNQVPVRIRQIARVSLGPAPRRGVLDKGGAEVAGGVVVARYGANPMKVIESVKDRIQQLGPGLPRKTLGDGTISQLTIVPFYDRSTLIKETLGTLQTALILEILITVLVIVVMIRSIGASLLISGLLPVAVLLTFIGMRFLGTEANIVSLAGIAIAIGTMVDVGIVLTENIIQRLRTDTTDTPPRRKVSEAAKEVTPAILTAILTTIVSFLPVFFMEGAEGKLFRPLAITKTIALVSSLAMALVIVPAFAHLTFNYFRLEKWAEYSRKWITRLPGIRKTGFSRPDIWLVSLILLAMLARYWAPLGAGANNWQHFLFTAIVVPGLLGIMLLLHKYYTRILTWCLQHKLAFFSLPMALTALTFTVWFGYGKMTAIVPDFLKQHAVYQFVSKTFPGLGKEFMPALDEGSFLLMPTSMPHAGMEENQEVLQQLDMAVAAIPEIESVVGKLGRAESALDPAPISMYENLIHYKSEYITDSNGFRVRFRVNAEGAFERDADGKLIPDASGMYFRQWRDHIHSPDDIWKEIAAIELPGVTSAPRLQPIETRLVMLQTGMRAPMGIKVSGTNLDSIQQFATQLETILKHVEDIQPATVFADRILSKPYLIIDIDREKIARYGLTVKKIQEIIEVGIGGMPLSQSVEGRERYAIRLRYARELRDDPGRIARLPVPAPGGIQVPLGELTHIGYASGPQMIRTEDNFLVAYVLFDRSSKKSEISVVEQAQAAIQKEIESGKLVIPAGVNFAFAGSYQQQARAEKKLLIIIPFAIMLVFGLLYLQFRSVVTSLMIFSGIWLAFCGGMLLVWLYGEPWFLSIHIGSLSLRSLFHIDTVNLSVAVWVGFIALFGIATDDGVVIATYLHQVFEKRNPKTRASIRKAVLEAGKRRIKPCLMTTATTVLALLPILTSTGRGSDIMIPMAIPLFGGMMMELVTLFIVPVLYAAWQEKILSAT
ncbi:MAG: efflux RND transporter permease subunit [Bacteroidia bacterium]